MNKKQLYFVVIVLGLGLLFVLFVPTGEPKREASSLEQAQEVPEKPTEAVSEEMLEVNVSDEATDDMPEQVTLEGEFLSLADGENQHGKTFKYMLLYDGVEVLRVDLRPLLGYSEIDVIQKLGVERGQEVRVVGIMEDGEFKVTSITQQ